MPSTSPRGRRTNKETAQVPSQLITFAEELVSACSYRNEMPTYTLFKREHGDLKDYCNRAKNNKAWRNAVDEAQTIIKCGVINWAGENPKLGYLGKMWLSHLDEFAPVKTEVAVEAKQAVDMSVIQEIANKLLTEGEEETSDN